MTIVKDGITIDTGKTEYTTADNESADLVENMIVRVGNISEDTYSEFILTHTGGVEGGLMPVYHKADNGGDAVLLIGGMEGKDKPFKCHRSGFDGK